MKRTITLCVILGLSACAPKVPDVTVNPTTNTVTVAPTPNPGTGIATALGNLAATDLADAYNLGCGNPVKDTIGCNFFTDLINLNKAVLAQSGQSSDVGQEGILTKVERIRLNLNSVSNISSNPLLLKTLIDGMIWVQDTKRKAIAVPQQIQGLLIQIQAGLLAP